MNAITLIGGSSPPLATKFKIKVMETKKVQYIFWVNEGIVSEVVSVEDGWFHYKYSLGQIEDAHNSFMGAGKIRFDALTTDIDNGSAFVF